jgi:hypothetical protein
METPTVAFLRKERSRARQYGKNLMMWPVMSIKENT